MDERAVAELRALAERDGALQERRDRLAALDGRVAALRARAEALDTFLAGYPNELARLREAAAASAADAGRHRDRLAAARVEEEAAHDGETALLARRRRERAEAHLADAETALTRVRSELGALEQRAAAAPDELAALRGAAAGVHADAPETPAPESSESLLAWASHAHAELFVALGHVDTQRERVVREAHELATMLLGEPTYGSTVAQARARVESAWAR